MHFLADYGHAAGNTGILWPEAGSAAVTQGGVNVPDGHGQGGHGYEHSDHGQRPARVLEAGLGTLQTGGRGDGCGGLSDGGSGGGSGLGDSGGHERGGVCDDGGGGGDGGGRGGVGDGGRGEVMGGNWWG